MNAEPDHPAATPNTPGEWSICTDDSTFWLPVVDERGKYICAVTERSERGEAEANARLIAAAPTLLATCEELLLKVEAVMSAEKRPTLAPWPKSGVEYVGVDVADSPLVRRARAVIAKAKGESR
jgi:hypothetical protein